MDQKFGQGQWKTVQHGDAEVANHIGHAGRGHYTAICRRTSMAIWTPGIKHLKSCQILPDQRSTKIHLSALVVWQASPAQSFLPLQWHGCSWGSCWCELILLRFSLQVASSISLGSCAWFDALSTDRFVQMMQRSSPRRCMQSCQPPNLEKFVRENHGTISSRDCFQHLLNGLPMTARFLAFGTLLSKATLLQAYLLFFMRRDISDWATCRQEDLTVNDCNWASCACSKFHALFDLPFSSEEAQSISRPEACCKLLLGLHASLIECF